MSSEFQKRVYAMEVTPPGEVWDKLSINLDEINADNLIAAKMHHTAVLPSSAVWDKIKDSFDIAETPVIRKKAVIISWRKFAVAAIFVGLLVSAWLIFYNPQNDTNDIVKTDTALIQENNPVTEIIEKNKPSDQTTSIPQQTTPLLANNKKAPINNNTSEKNNHSANQKVIPIIESEKNTATLRNDKPGVKVFDQPIDDLSMIAANDNYMTMVTSNGRIVKIPAHLAHLAPHLQDKPITEDYYEFMFGEGAFWKEKMSDWQQKLATSPVSSGDLFSNLVELLKSVDGK